MRKTQSDVHGVSHHHSAQNPRLGSRNLRTCCSIPSRSLRSWIREPSFSSLAQAWGCEERTPNELRIYSMISINARLCFVISHNQRSAQATYVLIPLPMEKPATTIPRGNLPFDDMSATALVSASNVSARISCHMSR